MRVAIFSDALSGTAGRLARDRPNARGWAAGDDGASERTTVGRRLENYSRETNVLRRWTLDLPTPETDKLDRLVTWCDVIVT